MGVGRAVYVLFFPLLLTLVGLVLSIITFFSGYENAPGLKNVHFMTIDLSGLELGGFSIASLIKDLDSGSTLHNVYTVATNGWCYGDQVGNVTACETPHEPFYFNIDEIFNAVGLSSKLIDLLPSSVQEYDSLSKNATYALWACFLITIIFSFLQLCFGVFAMCSRVSGRFAECFASLGFITAVIGSGIATGVYSIYTKKINDETSDLGIKATLDKSGLGCAWATAAALLVADVLYIIASCCCSSPRTRYVTVPEKAQYGY